MKEFEYMEVGEIWVANPPFQAEYIIDAVDRVRKIVGVKARRTGSTDWEQDLSRATIAFNVLREAATPRALTCGGSTICTGCGDDNPYAEPTPNYVCGSCRSYKAMYE